jgi:hypothetical protein
VHLRPPPEVLSPANGWPAVYTRCELDRYYDVVAAVLRVQPLPATLKPPLGWGDRYDVYLED